MVDRVAPLPRGRHGLTRAEVQASQRARMLLAMAETMTRKGYVATSVADVLTGAGVSRETFYQQFSSKLECFMAAFDAAGEVLLAGLTPLLGEDGSAIERFDRVLDGYLDTVAGQPAYARLFLVEVFAAGPEAIERRAALQQRIVDALVELLGVGAEQRFALELVVAGTGALVTRPLLADDMAAVRALRAPIVELIRTTWSAA